MVFADEIRRTILKLAEERGTERTFEPAEVAQAVDKKNWQTVLDQVKLVASILIREGKIISKGSGKTIDVSYSKKPEGVRNNHR